MPSIPGQRDGVTTTPKNVLKSQEGALYVPGGIVLDATYAYDGGNTSYEQRLRAGIILAQITASGLWAPCKRTKVNGSSGAVTSLVVDDARHFQVGDTITIDTDTGVSITAIDYTTNTLTIASTTVADGDDVYVDDANQTGLETPRLILNEFVDLIDKDDNTARDKQVGGVLAAGYIDASQILGDLAAMRGRTDITQYLDSFTWDDWAGNAA